MTYLRSAPSDFDDILPRPPAGVLVAAGGAAFDFAQTLRRSWRRAVEDRRARRELLELDDRLLDDIGLSRSDVHYSGFAMFGRRRGGVR